MVELSTNRLKLIPLGTDSTALCVGNDTSMLSGVPYRFYHKPVDVAGEIHRICLYTLMKNHCNALFYNCWGIVLKESNSLIGEVELKITPGNEGGVEVGYGIESRYRRKGYMTEALEELIKWLFIQNQVEVRFVVASTYRDNIPSQRVLKKVGMKLYRKEDSILWWRINKSY